MQRIRTNMGILLCGGLLIGCTVVVPNAPESGTTLRITDCKADPEILQVSQGSEITIVNSDAQAHVLLLDNQAIALPPKGSATVKATFSLGANATYNYLCDDKSLPYGGAIFVVP